MEQRQLVVDPSLPMGVELAGLGRRAVALLLDIILFPLLLVVGYVIWWLLVLGRGQTPGKQLTGIRIASADTGETAHFGLSFVREFVVEFLLFDIILGAITGTIAWWVDHFWAFFDRRKQTLHDKISGTIVVRGQPR
jgi:uncharacterized RDD family membrane protein YckC